MLLVAAGRQPLLVLLVLLACWPASTDAKRGRKKVAGGRQRAMLSPPPVTRRAPEAAHHRGWQRHTTGADTAATEHRLQAGLLPPPADTWRAFIRHSEDVERRANRRRKKKRRGGAGELPLPVRRGPAGPPGPPGPPGAVVTEELLVSELRKMIQEAAGEHLSGLLGATVNETGSEEGRKKALPSLFQLEEVALVSRVQAAFHVQLAKQVSIPPKMFVELSRYKLPFGGGTFQRGDALDLETGRFTAPEDGVYQLSAQILLRRRPSKGPRRRPPALPKPGRRRGHRALRASICIDSRCKRNSSLQYVSSVDPSAQLFTASIHGVLELRRGQYVSVHVDNATRCRLVAIKGSQFSGAMLGH